MSLCDVFLNILLIVCILMGFWFGCFIYFTKELRKNIEEPERLQQEPPEDDSQKNGRAKAFWTNWKSRFQKMMKKSKSKKEKGVLRRSFSARNIVSDTEFNSRLDGIATESAVSENRRATDPAYRYLQSVNKD